MVEDSLADNQTESNVRPNGTNSSKGLKSGLHSSNCPNGSIGSIDLNKTNYLNATMKISKFKVLNNIANSSNSPNSSNNEASLLNTSNPSKYRNEITSFLHLDISNLVSCLRDYLTVHFCLIIDQKMINGPIIQQTKLKLPSR